jgi:hypothetical protein
MTFTSPPFVTFPREDLPMDTGGEPFSGAKGADLFDYAYRRYHERDVEHHIVDNINLRYGACIMAKKKKKYRPQATAEFGRNFPRLV